MDITVVTSFDLEMFRHQREWRVSIEREIHTRQMRDMGIWDQIIKRSAIHFKNAIMLIGADP